MTHQNPEIVQAHLTDGTVLSLQDPIDVTWTEQLVQIDHFRKDPHREARITIPHSSLNYLLSYREIDE